jgi:endoglucanase
LEISVRRRTITIISLAALGLAAGCVVPARSEQPVMPPATTAAAPAPAGAPVIEPASPAPVAATTPIVKPSEPAAPPLPPWKHGDNPFVGAKLAWVDPYGPAHLKSKLASKTDPVTSALYAKIADNGGADWIGDWTPNVQNWVSHRVTAIIKTGALPLFISYNIPKRDCGQYSAGGAAAADGYKQWITAFAKGIGDRRAAVVLEPDSLGLLKKCLSGADQQERLGLLRFAVHAFAALGNTAVYIDAGHSSWLPAAEDAKRLEAAGIEEADGFALNVSNYRATPSEIKYGKQISKLVGGKHFVIDTSRNGNGPPTDCKGPDDENCWCNPPGRALGSPPTSHTSDPLVDAYLWLKKPGESDGACNGGPKAGVFWQEKALELARNAKY